MPFFNVCLLKSPSPDACPMQLEQPCPFVFAAELQKTKHLDFEKIFQVRMFLYRIEIVI